jgi:hypothetical protein
MRLLAKNAEEPRENLTPAAMVHTLRAIQTMSAITIMVPSNPNPSIVYLH